MAFFSNRTINYLNFHLALVNLLDQSYNIFGPIYFYTHGFKIPEILGLLALFNVLRIPFRLLSFPIIKRLGLKAGVMIGAVGYGISFPLLSLVQGFDGWLLLYTLVFAFFNALHWFCFHLFYSLAGERETRGRQVAVAYALTSGLSALAPLLSALAIVHTGFEYYFMLPFLLTIPMVFVLRRCNTIIVPYAPWSEGKKMAFNWAAKVHVLESALYYPMNVCWLLAVYLYVGKIVSLGGIITFGVIVQALYQLLLGTWVDRGRGTLIAHAAGSLQSMVAIAKALWPLSLSHILGIEAMAATSNVHYLAVKSTVIYNAGKDSPYPIWYWLFAEMAWDIGTVMGAVSAILLLWLGVELRHVILLALPFTAILWWLLYRYFAKHAYV